MKKFLPALFYLLVSTLAWAQDIPLFTQKLTNSFLYNPSVAGNTVGSFTLSHRQYWAGVQDAPKTNFLSFHMPFAYHKLGFGVNFYQDNIGVSETMVASGAFAYHIRFRNDNSFSMGVSAEYDNFKVNSARLDIVDIDDPLLSGADNFNQVDFGFGLSYQAKYYRVGASVNRLTGLIKLKDSTANEFPAHYAAFLNLMLPVGERHLLEPIVTYRSLAPGANQIDAGLYYTFRSFITIGAGYRTGGIMNFTAGLRVHKNILVGYSREIISGDYQRAIGSSNEFTIRLDFRDHAYHSKLSNARQINTQAMAIRRKTLVTYSSRGTSLQKSQRYKKQVKKNYIHSPNYRMNASKKLQNVKVSRKHSYNKRKKSIQRRR